MATHTQDSTTASVPAPEESSRPTRFVRRSEASRHLKEVWGIDRAPTTLAKLACIGGGPVYHKAGRVPLYKPEDLDAWARAMIQKAS
ncbi:MAG TPA: hypothetical protein VNS22_11515 [Geminicoccus sp.]|uniref:hypothetical protein n=1 Tax=Geminicoccus sp. TaxID=2024832 RepID=UPI002BAED0CA|nr:hypothetical protein [Geminicoccus sp.]HWL68999.1 hypothetical protein [Geminicoccus sp.]